MSKMTRAFFWGREADVDSARPRLVLVKRGPTGGTFVLVGIVQVDDVQVVARSVVVKERHGSILVEDAERKRWKEGEEEEEDIEASKAKEGGERGKRKETREEVGGRREGEEARIRREEI